MGVALCLTDWNNYLIRCVVSLFVDKLAVGYHLALSENTFGIFLWRHATIVLKAAVEVGHVVEAYHIAFLKKVQNEERFMPTYSAIMSMVMVRA